MGRHLDRVRELVAPLRIFRGFDRVLNFRHFKDIADGPSKDFRAALAIVSARLYGALEHITPLSSKNARTLIPEIWHKFEDENFDNNDSS